MRSSGAVFSAALAAMSSLGASASFAQGELRPEAEVIRLTGIATDEKGEPLSGLTVVLRAARKSVTLSKMRREEKGVVEVPVLTNSEGQFTIDWSEHSYYNRFWLEAVVPVGTPGGEERIVVLESIDISKRMRKGGSIVVPMALADATLFRENQEFLASIDGSDQEDVYAEMGKPDRVQRIRLPNHLEVSWWYFASGRVYRFREGVLDQVTEFDPVVRF